MIDPTIETREAREIGLIIELADPADGRLRYVEGWSPDLIEATRDPMQARRFRSAAEAHGIVELRLDGSGRVRSLRESGEIVSLDKQTDLYGDDLDVDDADAPF